MVRPRLGLANLSRTNEHVNHARGGPNDPTAALLAVAATALALVASIGAAPAAPAKLIGTVGPGSTISLKKGSSRVATLKRGRYTFVIRDRSGEHNFHLRGPVGKVFTSISWTGTKTVTVNLKPGRYMYVCDPHADEMIGSFRVR